MHRSSSVGHPTCLLIKKFWMLVSVHEQKASPWYWHLLLIIFHMVSISCARKYICNVSSITDLSVVENQNTRFKNWADEKRAAQNICSFSILGISCYLNTAYCRRHLGKGGRPKCDNVRSIPEKWRFTLFRVSLQDLNPKSFYWRIFCSSILFSQCRYVST